MLPFTHARYVPELHIYSLSYTAEDSAGYFLDTGVTNCKYFTSYALKSVVNLNFRFSPPPFLPVSGHCMPISYSHYLQILFPSSFHLFRGLKLQWITRAIRNTHLCSYLSLPCSRNLWRNDNQQDSTLQFISTPTHSFLHNAAT